MNTHLGEILNFNDTVLAYDITQANISSIEDFEKIDTQLPDVVIVKKTFPKFRRNQKKRFWKLKHFEDQKMEELPEEDQEMDSGDEEGDLPKKKMKKEKKGRKNKTDKRDIKGTKEYEQFLQDLEDDPELRANVNLYKDDDVIGELEAQIANMALDDKPSKLKADLESGTIGGRKVKTAARKTAIGKQKSD